MRVDFAVEISLPVSPGVGWSPGLSDKVELIDFNLTEEETPMTDGRLPLATADHIPDNGKAERFIQTALREWAYAVAYPNSDHRAAELAIWLHRYNWHRPNGSLKSKTPISRLGQTGDNLLRLHN